MMCVCSCLTGRDRCWYKCCSPVPQRPRLDAQLDTISAVKTPSFFTRKIKNKIEYYIRIVKLACIALVNFTAVNYTVLIDWCNNKTAAEYEDH